MNDPRQQRPVTPPQFRQYEQYGQQPQQYQQPQYQQQPQPQFQPRHQAPPPRRRRGNSYIAWTAAGIAVLLAGAAFYVIHNRTPSPSASAALTCPQQYQAWKTGPAKPDGVKVKNDAAALSKAGEDIPVITSDLKTLGTDAAALQAYPMPKCADPAGYWSQYLGAMKASGDNAGTSSGLGGLILAEAPLKQVPAIQSKLTAELTKTVGLKPS